VLSHLVRGVWVCGCVGVWVCGCVGVWVCGCVGAPRECVWCSVVLLLLLFVGLDAVVVVADAIVVALLDCCGGDERGSVLYCRSVV
jgi:hypothetical protein